MPPCFFDSSALTKEYVHERGRISVRERMAATGGHPIYPSLLTAAVIANALARRQREGSLNLLECERLLGAFLMDCARSYLWVGLEEYVIEQTVALLSRYPFRTADAIGGAD